MKNIFILFVSIFAFAGCPKESEVRDMVEGLQEKKLKAEELIAANHFSTDNLMTIQEYFFDFSEKVHLLKAEDKASERVMKMAKKSGTIKFCQDFFISKSAWEALNQFCEQDGYYACSFEIKEFEFIAEEFKKVLGVDFEASSENVKECFN